MADETKYPVKIEVTSDVAGAAEAKQAIEDVKAASDDTGGAVGNSAGVLQGLGQAMTMNAAGAATLGGALRSLWAVMLANPVGWVAAGMSALTVVLQGISMWWNRAERAAEAAAEEAKRAADAYAAVKTEMDALTTTSLDAAVAKTRELTEAYVATQRAAAALREEAAKDLGLRTDEKVATLEEYRAEALRLNPEDAKGINAHYDNEIASVRGEGRNEAADAAVKKATEDVKAARERQDLARQELERLEAVNREMQERIAAARKKIADDNEASRFVSLTVTALPTASNAAGRGNPNPNADKLLTASERERLENEQRALNKDREERIGPMIVAARKAAGEAPEDVAAAERELERAERRAGITRSLTASERERRMAMEAPAEAAAVATGPSAAQVEGARRRLPGVEGRMEAARMSLGTARMEGEQSFAGLAQGGNLASHAVARAAEAEGKRREEDVKTMITTLIEQKEALKRMLELAEQETVAVLP